MSKWILITAILFSLILPCQALELEAPEVPDSGREWMPQRTETFSEGLRELLGNTLTVIQPDIKEAVSTALSVITASMILSLLQAFSGSAKQTLALAGTIWTAAILIRSSNSLIHLGADTIQEMSDYGKLLFPVMTTAMASQGGLTASAALYAGTAAFDTVLGSLLSDALIPMLYLFLALAAANAALGEDILKQLRDLIKNVTSWCLKTLLMIYTTYMSITGVVSGTTDAVALKATRVTISSVVPVVGGILSDASESVLVSAGLMKNAAGIYGILAVLAVFLSPFLRIGLHYLILKLTAALCAMIAPRSMAGLVSDFSSAMGLLLSMTGAVCLFLLISTICFMKGVGM